MPIWIPNTDWGCSLFSCSILLISRAYEGCEVEVAGSNGGCAWATLLFLFSLPLLKVHNPDMTLEKFPKDVNSLSPPHYICSIITEKLFICKKKNRLVSLFVPVFAGENLRFSKKLISMVGKTVYDGSRHRHTRDRLTNARVIYKYLQYICWMYLIAWALLTIQGC